MELFSSFMRSHYMLPSGLCSRRIGPADAMVIAVAVVPNPITHGTKHYQLGGNETICLSAMSLSLSGRINQSGSSPSGFLPTLKDASPRSDIFIVSQPSIA
jgi:hypothetical protein